MIIPNPRKDFMAASGADPPCPWLLSVAVLQNVNGYSTSSQLHKSWQVSKSPRIRTETEPQAATAWSQTLLFPRNWSQHLGSIQVDRGDAKTNLALMAITFVWLHPLHPFTECLSPNCADTHPSFTVSASITSSFSYRARASVHVLAMSVCKHTSNCMKTNIPEYYAHIRRMHTCMSHPFSRGKSTFFSTNLVGVLCVLLTDMFYTSEKPSGLSWGDNPHTESHQMFFWLPLAKREGPKHCLNNDVSHKWKKLAVMSAQRIDVLRIEESAL